MDQVETIAGVRETAAIPYRESEKVRRTFQNCHSLREIREGNLTAKSLEFICDWQPIGNGASNIENANCFLSCRQALQEG